MSVVHSKTKISKERISEERKDYLRKKFQHAAGEFRRVATTSEHPGVPKEEQLSVDLGNKKVFGIIDRILKWIENKFKYFFPRYNLFPEVGTEEREIPETESKIPGTNFKIPGTNSKVKYFTLDEQFNHRIIVGRENGKLRLYGVTYNSTNGNLLVDKPYDTSGEVSKKKKGCVAYVITLDGKLITHEHINVGEGKDAYRHSTLAGGKPVLCAGLIRVVDGEITYIDNNSGHYKPTSANLYKAIKKLKGVFSEDAKVHCLTNWSILRQDLPFLCRLPDTTEPVKQFLEKMEKVGKDGLTRYERHFARIEKYNKQYEQKLHLASYKSPTSEPPNKPTIHKKHRLKFSSYINSYLKFLKEFDEDPEVRKITIERSIRKIIGAEPIHKIGHMPKIKLVKNEIVQDGKIQEGEKIIGINVTFHYKDDYNRFIRLLALKKFKYFASDKDANKLTNTPIRSNKYVVSIDTDDANKFIKNILKININIEELASALKSFEEKVALEYLTRKTLIESSIRKIIEASSFDSTSHMPKIEHNHKKVFSITFPYEDDYNKFIEVLDSQQLNYTSHTQVSKYIITMSTEQADKFISHYLGSNINIKGMVASTLSNLEPLNTNYCNAIQ